jgi:alpha-N-arabinofuranosidase
MPTFPAWEATVLEHTYDVVDYISLHTYYGNAANDTPTFLARSLDMERFIQSVVATCDYVQAKLRHKKVMALSFDEWNVWFHSHTAPQPDRWSVAPPQLEDVYTFEDALVVGAMLITLLRHADRVKLACLAQLVNVIAPILTTPGGGCWQQTIFYPFYHVAQYGRGLALNMPIHSAHYANAEFGEVPYLDAIATLNPEDETLTVFALNRHPTQPLTLTSTGMDLKGYTVLEHLTLTHKDPKAQNTAAAPHTVIPRSANRATLQAGHLHAPLPKLSWNVIRLAKRPPQR